MKVLRARNVICFVVVALCVGAASQPSRITARQLVDEIQKQVGVKWKKDTVDTFKAGNPDTPVTGVAVTMMATMDVLQRASAKGLNFIITHEPTFYAHLDTPEGVPEDDPVWAEKRVFIDEGHPIVRGRGDNDALSPRLETDGLRRLQAGDV